MAAAYSVADASGAYIASVISKSGRNEVQMYGFAAGETPSPGTPPIRRFELHSTHSIACVAWFNDSIAAAPRSGKRKNGDAEPNGTANGHGAALLLAVATEDNEVWILSPHKSEPVSTLTGTERFVALTSSAAEHCFWGLTDAAALVEVNALSGEPVKSVKFGKTDADAALLARATHRLKLRAAHEPQPLVVASARMHLVDGGRTRKHVVAAFATADPDSTLPDAEVSAVLLLAVAPDGRSVVVAREGSSVLQVYDVADPLLLPQEHQCAGTHIVGVAALAGDLAVALTPAGAEVFAMRDDESGPQAVVRTSSQRIAVQNVCSTQQGTVAVWYDGVQPRFAVVDPLDGDVVVDVGQRTATGAPARDESPDITFSAIEAVEIANVAPAELYAQLAALLLAKKPRRNDVLLLCLANDDEDTIKDTIRQFSAGEQCLALVNTLFDYVADKIAADPTRRLPLSVWLKWLLLAHGGYISRQRELAEKLRHLQSSLDVGMKMMPKLLALQGRLSLLKLQAELRSQIGQQDEQQSEQEEFNETFNASNVEESIVYANGENDDFDNEE